MVKCAITRHDWYTLPEPELVRIMQEWAENQRHAGREIIVRVSGAAIMEIDGPELYARPLRAGDV